MILSTLAIESGYAYKMIQTTSADESSGAWPLHAHRHALCSVGMVVSLMTHGHTFLLQLSPKLLVHLHSRRSGLWKRVVLEDAAHVMEQSGGREHHRGCIQVILPVYKELRIVMPLPSGSGEPEDGLVFVVLHILTIQAEFAQQVLGMGLIMLRRKHQIFQCSEHILLNDRSLQAFLAHTVGSMDIAVLRSFLQPPDAKFRVPYLFIIREIEFAQRILSDVQPLFSRRREPVFSLDAVRYHRIPVTVELPQKILRMNITGLGQGSQLFHCGTPL